MKIPLFDSSSKSCCFPYNDQGDVVHECPVCGADFKKSGFAWLSFGSHLAGEHYEDEKFCELLEKIRLYHRCFLSVGYHGSENADSQLRKRKDEAYDLIHIVDDAPFDQLDINFCSIRCLRNWFNSILDDFVIECRQKNGYDP